MIRYAAAMERAYTAALGADAGYAGRFHHNPFSDTYVTKVGRDAPYSLAEVAQYVDLTGPPQKKSAPTGICRNVEVFDRLRRWAYAAVTDWRMATRTAGGVYEGWCGAVSDRAGQIAAEVGAEAPAVRSRITKSGTSPRASPVGSGSATVPTCRRSCAKRGSLRSSVCAGRVIAYVQLRGGYMSLS